MLIPARLRSAIVGRRRLLAVGVGALTLLVLVTVVLGWRLVDGIRNATQGPLPDQADAIVVFAGEERRFELGRQLADQGRAPVLVLSAGALPGVADGWCEAQSSGFEVVCLVPEPASTGGEAAAFGQLAEERRWGTLIGVTGDYHAQRAGMLLSQCFGGEVSWALVDWPTPSRELTGSEFLKTIGDWVTSRDC